MIPARPYIEPAKDKLANYKQITARHEAIVLARHVADRWFVRRRWENQFGGGNLTFTYFP